MEKQRHHPEGNLRSLLRQKRVRMFGGYALLLVLAFCRPLVDLARYALSENLHSHILLIPFVCAYLIFLKRGELGRAGPGSPVPAALFLVVGLAGLFAIFSGASESWSRNDSLGLATGTFLCLLVAGAFQILGHRWMRTITFPIFFLIFLIPLPDRVVLGVENMLVLASAEVTALLFKITGTPVYRTGQVFELPGVVLEVARECSGIRSSWVLLITSFLASYLLLQTTWRRALIVGLVIPLGILRNGFRILVIGLLCVRYGPHMIDSPVHRSGGPYFFALSLLPLFLLLWWLRRGEGTDPKPGPEHGPDAESVEVGGRKA